MIAIHVSKVVKDDGTELSGIGLGAFFSGAYLNTYGRLQAVAWVTGTYQPDKESSAPPPQWTEPFPPNDTDPIDRFLRFSSARPKLESNTEPVSLTEFERRMLRLTAYGIAMAEEARVAKGVAGQFGRSRLDEKVKVLLALAADETMTMPEGEP